MTRPKIAVIGAGQVGGMLAFMLAQRELGDILLLDVVEGLPQGKALDIMEARPIIGSDVTLTGTNDYRDLAGTNVAIVTAGLPRKPGMSREDLLEKNLAIIRDVAGKIKVHCSQAFVIVISNPLDVMSFAVKMITGFPKERVVGMAGVLDSARFSTFVAMELGVSVREVSALVLGGHGDAMVPLPRYCSVSGVPLTKLLSEDRIEAIVNRTRFAGEEIVRLLGRGSAFCSPAAAAAEMVQAHLRDEKRLLPCSAYLEGEYGLSGCYMGVPVVIGRGGVEKVVEVELTSEEREALTRSFERVKELAYAVNL